ncbi:MAG TPA: FHA domain-containing protein [Kofleriaceae bacterium]|nr:FHA domain-containing protein [Kofleriaceae bacterium]
MRDMPKMTLTLDGSLYGTIEVETTVLLGSGRAADVQVPETGVAPLHLRLVNEEQRIIAVALAPGVLVDGTELEIGIGRELGDKAIDIGALRLVTAPPRSVDDRPQRTESMARELMRKLMGATEGEYHAQPEFVVEGGPANGQRRAFSRVEDRMILGRGESASWILLDPDLSRNHAAIERHKDAFRIYDMRSKNGTKVNGRPVGIGAPGVVLEDGAIITLGDTRIRYIDPAAAMLAELEANADANARGIPGAITQTRPGHGRALEAVSAAAEANEQRRLRRRTMVVIASALLIAAVSAVLLIALIASS